MDGPPTDANDDKQEGDTSRDVVVPLRVYKAVTVFSTLFSVILVVGGFLLLDAATNQAQAQLSNVDPILALLGLACIAGGGMLYAFASRFRARGMGNAKERTDE